MPILAKFEKQPADVQDYDISFVDWLAGFKDAAVSFEATADAGITIARSSLDAGVVKVWLADGTSGKNYKITVTLTTNGGRVKQAEILISVRAV